MYDSTNPANIPAEAPMVAGYDNGPQSQWPAEGWDRWPASTVKVHITISADADGDVLDVETGDASPADAPGWATRQRDRGAWPVVYMNRATWPAVQDAFSAAGVDAPGWWLADPTGLEHLESGTIATQWAWDGPYDRSAVDEAWTYHLTGTEPPGRPVPVVEDEMAQLPKVIVDQVSGGFWLVTPDGGVQTFDGAPFPGSLPGHPEWNAGGPGDRAVDAAYYDVSGKTGDDGKRGLVIFTLDGGGIAHPYHLSRDGKYAPHPAATSS